LRILKTLVTHQTFKYKRAFLVVQRSRLHLLPTVPALAMKTSGTSRRRAANVEEHTVLSVCLNRFPADALHTLSLASKGSKAQVKAVVRQRLPELLPGAVAHCVARNKACVEEEPDYFNYDHEPHYEKRVVDWLLKTAGRRVLNQPAAAQALLFMPRPSSAGVAPTAQRLGFRTSCIQVLAAAEQQVPHCERWGRCVPRSKQSELWTAVCSFAGRQVGYQTLQQGATDD
jgi:hypothetical protein